MAAANLPTKSIQSTPSLLSSVDDSNLSADPSESSKQCSSDASDRESSGACGFEAVSKMDPTQESASLVMVDDLDRLESRLERFVQSKQCSQPSPRKNSAGSHIPKPDIGPKPTFLISACRGATAVSQSLLRPPKATTIMPTSKKDSQDSSKTLASKASGTASMLKSTLKRMTRLSINTRDKSVETSPEDKVSSITRSKSFKETIDPLKMTRSMIQAGAIQRNSAMSSSLRRPRTKDREEKQTFQRSGTGGTWEHRGAVSRSHSVTGRRFKDRDLDIKKSRAVQTQLTRDVLADEDSDIIIIDNQNGSTNLEFTLYLPELIGADVDHVETHVSEPTEPVDVRKNRQLTLDNMKLQREVERLKSQVTENDVLKKELRTVKSKLEEEQKSRTKIEQQLDKHNEKVRMIVQSMDHVEREFENRDENVMVLEKQLEDYKLVVGKLQDDNDASTTMIISLQLEVEKNLAAQKILLNQYQESEAESRELQEFLQAEKMTLAETLKDCETEILGLKIQLQEKDNEIVGVEERCSHLVRLGEQRHQEAMAMQAQLNSGQERAKDMLLAQGAEISRANIHVCELYSRLEKLIGDGQTSSTSRDENLAPPFHSDLFPGSSLEEATSDTISTADDTNPFFANFPRSHSQFLVPTSGSDDLYGLTSSSQSDNFNGVGMHMSESLQNLSKAITNRQKSETGQESLASSSASLPSLVDRINDVQMLIDKYVKEQERITKGHAEGISEGIRNKNNKQATEEKENVSSNGVHHQIDEQLKCKENEINELKTKFLKHRQILVSNYEQAESEIRRLDEIYHDTVEQVLNALSTIPEVVTVNSSLQQLKRNLEISFSDGKGIKKEIATVLKADNINANQSL